MQKHWLIRRPENARLLIVALGWASEPAAAPPPPADYDLLCLCDYRSIDELVPEAFCSYECIDLVAWSFGVMIAERVAWRLSLRRALAFNGSPLPVDDRFGIPTRSFLVTLKGLPRAGTNLFFERAYGGPEQTPASHRPQRSLETLIEELAYLHVAARQPRSREFRWDAAFIGKRDAIFPPGNLSAYWGERGRLIDAPHYPFTDVSLLHRALAE